jgi:hypothetical protein
MTKRLPNRQPEVETIYTKICHLFGYTVLVLFSFYELNISITITFLARVGASTKARIIKVSKWFIVKAPKSVTASEAELLKILCECSENWWVPQISTSKNGFHSLCLDIGLDSRTTLLGKVNAQRHNLAAFEWEQCPNIQGTYMWTCVTLLSDTLLIQYLWNTEFHLRNN